jgi:hypothetical protein
MSSNLLDVEIEEVLHDVFAGGADDLYVVNPSAGSIEELVTVATAYEEPLPEMRLLADERVLKDVMDDFIVASNAADLVEDGTLTLRTTEDPPENSLLVTDERVVALVTAGDTVGGLVTDDDDFVATAADAYRAAWDGADEFNLRTPPLSRVKSSLEEEIGPDAEGDFEAVLASLDTARGDGQGLDEVTISLVVAARNEELLYDISKWGEDVGIAEKVPIDVGRPRLRLKLGDERLADADTDQLAGVATSILN